MNDLFNDIRIYLPKYLSEEDQTRLFSELSSYPENMGRNFYISHLNNEPNLFQGDILDEIIVPNYAKSEFRAAKGFLISNTCDIAASNPRLYTPFLVYSPIFSLKKYELLLLSKHPQKTVDDHLEKIRKQKITTFFYLPPHGVNLEESYVRLDIIHSLPTNETFVQNLVGNLPEKRLFSLSDYGFYILLLKLSIHFTRIRENVERGIDT